MIHQIHRKSRHIKALYLLILSMIIYMYVLYLSKRGTRLIKNAQDLDRGGGGPNKVSESNCFLLYSTWFNRICFEEIKMVFNLLNIIVLMKST